MGKITIEQIIAAITAIAFVISEVLARIKGIKANSISELIVPRKDNGTS